MATRSLYRLLIIYEDTSKNRKKYKVDLDGQMIGEIGDEIILNYSMSPGWHTLTFSSKWGTDRTERFYVSEDQYVTRFFVQVSIRNGLDLRADSGTSALVNQALHGPPEERQPEPNYIPAPPAAPAPTRRRTRFLPLLIAFIAGVLCTVLFFQIIRPAWLRSFGSSSAGRSAVTATSSPEPETSPELNTQDGGLSARPIAVASDGRNSGDLGDFHVDIRGAVLTQDDEGGPAIVITYSWTNNSAVTTSAMVSMVERAFQNGVQLSITNIEDTSIYDSETQWKEIRPGTTVDVQTAFKLTSRTAVVEFELSELLGFTNEIVSMNFDPTQLG